MGEAIAKMILPTAEINESYTRTGNIAYSFSDIASILSEASGTNIRFESPDPNDYAERLKQCGVEDEDIYISSLFGAVIKK